MIKIKYNHKSVAIKKKHIHICTILYKSFNVHKDTTILIEHNYRQVHINLYNIYLDNNYGENYIELIQSLTKYINEYLNYKIENNLDISMLTYDELLNIITIMSESKMNSLYFKFISVLYDNLALLEGIRIGLDIKFYRATNSLYINKSILCKINEMIKDLKLNIPRILKNDYTKDALYYMHQFIEELG